MPRSAPGPRTFSPITSTSPVVGGCWGRSPAISRRIVLLPLPLGPRTQMNSPFADQVFNDERDVANRGELVRFPALNVLVTSRNWTTCGSSHFTRLANAGEHSANANRLARSVSDDRSRFWIRGAHGVLASAGAWPVRASRPH